MAELSLSGLVSDMSGKIGSIVVYRRNGHLLSRTWKKPRNDKTSFQKTVRANWQSLRVAWGALSDNDRNSWKFAAAQIFNVNSIASKYHPSGYQLYLTCNSNLISCGLPTLNRFFSPIPFNSLLLPTAKVYIDNLPIPPVFHVNILFAGQTTQSNLKYLIYASPGLSAGIGNGNKYLRLISSIPPLTTDAFACQDAYTARFKQPTNGQRVFFKLVPVDITSGISGQRLYFNCIMQSF